MKISILLLGLLFILCVLLPTILKTMEGIDAPVVIKNEKGEIVDITYSTRDTQYDPKTTKLNPNVVVVDPDQDIVTPASVTKDYSNDPASDFDKFIKHSKIIDYDASLNQAASYSPNIPVHSKNFEAGYYLNQSTPSLVATTGVSTNTASAYYNSTSDSTSSNPVAANSRNTFEASLDNAVSSGISPTNLMNSYYSSSDAPVSTEKRIDTNIGVIQYLSNLFKKNNEGFVTRRVIDISDNASYDISANYELYNERGQLKKGYHDSTDYGSWFDALQDEYKTLENKYNNAVKPIKCVADFGTDIGEDLCCGQEGVLQDTKFICPDHMPTCSNFKCGSKFGTCMSLT
jgi:hypothetical protein